MRVLRKTLVIAAVLSAVGCTNSIEPKDVPLQFQSFNPVTIFEIVTITPQPSSVKVTGSYEGAACGAVGAVASLDGSRLRLVVGPREESDVCDAARVLYAYSATIFDIDKGNYTVQVFHRTNGGEKAKLAASQEIVVQWRDERLAPGAIWHTLAIIMFARLFVIRRQLMSHSSSAVIWVSWIDSIRGYIRGFADTKHLSSEFKRIGITTTILEERAAEIDAATPDFAQTRGKSWAAIGPASAAFLELLRRVPDGAGADAVIKEFRDAARRKNF